jgi:hypothetical protein
VVKKPIRLTAALFCFISALLASGQNHGSSDLVRSYRRIVSKRAKNIEITLTSPNGKLKAGQNDMCVIFRDTETGSSPVVQVTAVEFRQAVGKVQEAPIDATITRVEAGLFCGNVNLGTQYYFPSNYYVLVHHVDAVGRRKKTRFFVVLN